MVTHTAFFLSTTWGFLCAVPTPLEAMRPMGPAVHAWAWLRWLTGSLPTQPSLPVPVQIKNMWGRDGIACSILSIHCPNYWLQWGMVFLDWMSHQFVLCWRPGASLSCPPIFFLFSERKGMHAAIQWSRSYMHHKYVGSFRKEKEETAAVGYWRCTVCLLTADKYGIEKKGCLIIMWLLLMEMRMILT